MDKVEMVVENIDGFMSKYPTVTQYDRLKDLETKTGYPKAYFFLAIVVFLSVLVAIVGGFKLVTDLIGFIYPAYMSFKAMEAAPKGGVSETTEWLTYWLVFSSFVVLEGIANFIVRWIPMYYFLKAGVIIWLYHPKTMGAKILYDQVVKKHVTQHIDVSKPAVKKTD